MNNTKANADPMSQPLDAVGQIVVCPRCGLRQRLTGVDATCQRCGERLTPVTVGPQSITGQPFRGKADPTDVTPPTVGGGIGGVNDGTQVTHRPHEAIPGKPMAPTTNEPAGSDTLLGETMDPPAEPAKRGGSG